MKAESQNEEDRGMSDLDDIRTKEYEVMREVLSRPYGLQIEYR